MGDMDWINLAEERERWRELVNTVMNFYILLTVHHVLILGN